MDTNLSSKLKNLREQFSQKLSDRDAINIKKIMQGQMGDPICSLEFNQSLRSYVLAIEILLSVLQLEMDSSTIQIRLDCLSILIEPLGKTQVYEEMKKIRKILKEILFDISLPSSKFKDILKTIIRSKFNLEIYEIVFDSNFLLKLGDIHYILYSVQQLLEESEINMISEIYNQINSAFQICEDLKLSYSDNLRTTFAYIIDQSQITPEIKDELKTINQNSYKKRIRTPCLEILCESLDKTIKKLIKNPDNFIIFSMHNSSESSSTSVAIDELNNIIKNSQVNMIELLSRFLETRINRDTSIPQYLDFEVMFSYTIQQLIIHLTSENISDDLMKFNEFRFKGFNLSKAFRFLRQLPLHISQTVCEIMNSASNPKYQNSFFEYFLSTMYKDLNFKKITEKESNTFISLALQPPFKEILEKFKTSEYPLEDELRKVTPNIHFMSLPKELTGVTLKTLQISLKFFKNEDFSEEHLLGGNFLIYLHELAHYLQRTQFSCVRDTNQRLSPNLDASKPDEGGLYLERLIFGSEQKIITENQAKFLVSGGYPESIEQFRIDYNQAQAGDSKVLLLAKFQNFLVLGNCGSFFGIEPAILKKLEKNTL